MDEMKQAQELELERRRKTTEEAQELERRRRTGPGPGPQVGQPVLYVDIDGREEESWVTKVHPEREGKLGRKAITHPASVDLRQWSNNRLRRTVAPEGTEHAKTGEPITRQCYRPLRG
jgi:hypothetical protein